MATPLFYRSALQRSLRRPLSTVRQVGVASASTSHLTTSNSHRQLHHSSTDPAPLQRRPQAHRCRPPTPSRYALPVATAAKTRQQSQPSLLPPTRTFSSTPSLARDHHFDTLKFVQRLQSEGLSEVQAKALMRVLSDVIEESIQNLTRTMVLREDALKTSYTQKVDFSALRTELLNLDNNENSLTRSSHERLTNELQKLNNRLRDEIQRTQASVRLDLNLEKGRIREETNSQELKIKETETRIEQEVAGLRERVEAVKFSTLQWLMGVCTGTAALLLGAWRLLM